jgi:thymidylate synthase
MSLRIYTEPVEAFEEIKRDLKEMGIKVYPKTMQDKKIEGNEEYATMELQNYSYSILNADSKLVPEVSQPWAEAEFEERIQPRRDFSSDACCKCPIWGREEESPENCLIAINPGKAYQLRPEVWEEFLHNGRFAYTYNERLQFKDQLRKIIDHIKVDPDSRQLWLSIWNPSIDVDNIGGSQRVPCSLGYGFQVRNGKLNLHYVMRSADFATHFKNDVYLAMRMMEYVSQQTGYPVGDFVHTIFSLHIYLKDVQDVF